MHPQPASNGALPQADRTRRTVGLVLLVLGCTVGLALNIALFVMPELGSSDRGLDVLGRAAAIAYLPVALYLFVPYFVDRYDPEPWWTLAGVFVWGAFFATGASAVVNTLVARQYGAFVSTAISAPLVEELTKGLAVFGMVYFWKREFDGVVDGIIYGTFAAIGFAATENIVYYARHHDKLESLFILRGVLTPWLHPLFSSMVGIGFGMGREHHASWAKVVFPVVGYVVGALLHAWWNAIPQLFGKQAFVQNLVFGLVMAVAFFAIICVLVYRKGKTIRRFLRDEVAIGTITQEEFDVITAAGGRLKARLSWRGALGAKFVRAGARLSLSKWHTARAMKGSKRTLSTAFIVPLRQELMRLHEQMEAIRPAGPPQGPPAQGPPAQGPLLG